MGNFYQIEISTVTNYIYRKPLLFADDNGGIVSEYRKNNSGILIKKMPLLNVVEYDESDRLVSFEPLDVVNEFLMAKAIDDGVLELGTTAQGLAHYFTFILHKQAQWDSVYDEDDFNELYDEPRPAWNYLTRNKKKRITYQYRDGLQLLAVNGDLAKTTVKQYISSVVNFYKHWLRRGYSFNNPPFQHEVVTIHYEASASSMKPYQRKDIHTTDLRLKFSKSSRSGGTALENLRRDLKPFTDSEWKVIQDILMKSRRVIRHGDDSKLHSLPVEFCLHFMICRYSGMRREEAASLHCGQTLNPEVVIKDGKEVFEQPVLNIGIGDEYESLTKTPDASNKSRVTIMPASLMKTLYDYTQSERYSKRLKKFNAWCKSEIEAGNTAYFEGDDAINPSLDYLFITQTGKPMFARLNDFTLRWGEVRHTANLSQSIERHIIGSIHNLRATFAVNLFRFLLRKVDEHGNPAITPDDALDRVSALLGHEDRATTMLYLKIAQDMPSSDEIYEDVLDYIGAFDDIEVT